MLTIQKQIYTACYDIDDDYDDDDDDNDANDDAGDESAGDEEIIRGLIERRAGPGHLSDEQ